MITKKKVRQYLIEQYDQCVDDDEIDELEIRLYGFPDGSHAFATGDSSYDILTRSPVFVGMTTLDLSEPLNEQIEEALQELDNEAQNSISDDIDESVLPTSVFADEMLTSGTVRSRDSVALDLALIHADYGRQGIETSIPVTLVGSNWGEFDILIGEQHRDSCLTGDYSWKIHADLDIETRLPVAIEQTLTQFEDQFTNLTSHDTESRICRQLWESLS